MTTSTKTIIVSAITGDPTISQHIKDKLIRYITNPVDEPELRLLTESQAAIILGVSKATIARMKREGTLKTRKVRRRKKITAESLYSITN